MLSRPNRDAQRDVYLKRRGLRVLRFWNSELGADFDGVRWIILSACRESDPSRRGEHIDRRR
jgi:very-short-patch-repair endonuclease